jgi:tellurite resistance protein TerC
MFRFLIMASFKVPRADQQKALLFGIVFSLLARTAFIFVGAALVNSYAFVFYIFGLVLLVTAGHMLKPGTTTGRSANHVIVRLAMRFLRTSETYDGDRLFTVDRGRRVMTPMLLVVVAIGGTDVLFALDSIPAIFGLTQSVFIVFTATAFSLLGLRQLYFLIDGLLDRLIYLSYGLAAILTFIGVKLILHALHENNLPFVN